MRGLEWVIAILLVIMGISCLAISGTFMYHPPSLLPYLNMLFKVCVWIGIPLAVIGIVYILWLLKQRRKKDQ